MVVVSVAYRLAPEFPFPAALDDLSEAYSWVQEHGEEYGADPKTVVVMGSSAGGNIAAAFAASRSGDPQTPIALQVLLYPSLDSSLACSSVAENASGYYLTRKQLQWYWTQYVPDPGKLRDPLASPTYRRSLVGLPPAIVVTAEHDPLHDEGSDYAARLAADGVPVHHFDFRGQIHGFLALIGIVPGVEDSINILADTISASLHVKR